MHLTQASGLLRQGRPRQLTVSSVFPEDNSSAYAVLQCLPTCAIPPSTLPLPTSKCCVRGTAHAGTLCQAAQRHWVGTPPPRAALALLGLPQHETGGGKVCCG